MFQGRRIKKGYNRSKRPGIYTPVSDRCSRCETQEPVVIKEEVNTPPPVNPHTTCCGGFHRHNLETVVLLACPSPFCVLWRQDTPIHTVSNIFIIFFKKNKKIYFTEKSLYIYVSTASFFMILPPPLANMSVFFFSFFNFPKCREEVFK